MRWDGIARRFPEGGGDSGELLTSRRQAEAVQRASECLRAVFEGMGSRGHDRTPPCPMELRWMRWVRSQAGWSRTM